MTLRRTLRRLIRRALRLLEQPEPEPQYNAAQRRGMEAHMARLQERIEPLSYCRPRPTGVSHEQLDALLDFHSPDQVVGMLARCAAKEH